MRQEEAHNIRNSSTDDNANLERNLPLIGEIELVADDGDGNVLINIALHAGETPAHKTDIHPDLELGDPELDPGQRVALRDRVDDNGCLHVTRERGELMWYHYIDPSSKQQRHPSPTSPSEQVMRLEARQHTCAPR